MDVFSHNGGITLVFDYMETDLESVIKHEDIMLSPADIKSYMQMLLCGVEHCHKNWVLHRVHLPLISDDTVRSLTHVFVPSRISNQTTC